jgi:hypothetical protein
MANVKKVLGQLDSAVATLETLYTVPGATQAVLSNLHVCNRSATPDTFRVAIRPVGAGIDPKHYIAYDVPIGANESIPLQVGITLAATDVVSVYSTNGNVSWNAFGYEEAA